jgi:ABC-2 type transport system permease protein
LSPFYYYSSADPITNGLHIGHAGVLLATTAVLLAIAVVTFNRRDLGV